ncbi:hypothetical protein EPICR_30161 [Candidatus Desulfarcum epimagneticum]|uniref:Uncharacterized protein n=1 Tax=uncultured Desulfobacteraceae bacterium TaxID=218296 RepID=A0A484HKV7_9BACT|nr:hypothetical protein EPICR_30161 [uncultured Desulfobacteraceae bacterium]
MLSLQGDGCMDSLYVEERNTTIERNKKGGGIASLNPT